MGWYDYFSLLEKYNGNLEKASGYEMAAAALANPNDPVSAREMAEWKWKQINGTKI